MGTNGNTDHYYALNTDYYGRSFNGISYRIGNRLIRRQFTLDGSDQDTVGVRQHRSQNKLSFFVKDNGPGILEEDQAFLFNKYYRGQRERERLEGVGLGLSIVKNIVESHHGTVWVSSQVGKGSTFGFTLPSAPG